MKTIFISKFKITENQGRSDVSGNKKVVYGFLQNEIHKGKVLLVKVNLIPNSEK